MKNWMLKNRWALLLGLSVLWLLTGLLNFLKHRGLALLNVLLAVLCAVSAFAEKSGNRKAGRGVAFASLAGIVVILLITLCN